MKTNFFGKLINNAGNGNYKTPDSVENVIRYITRTNKNPKSDLIAWGGVGILKYTGVDSVIHQFELAQKMNERNSNENRFIDHEFFSFSTEGERLLTESNVDLEQLAQELASDFYDIDGCQVVYGVHAPDDSDKHLHIHFAINTFDRYSGKKRRENTSETKDREARFQQVIAARIKEEITKKTDDSPT